MDEPNKNCIFCKIVKKEIPCNLVYEDKNFLVFLDIKPVVKGHCLLIPKEHHVWMQETPSELISEGFVLTKIIMNKIISGLNCDRVEVIVDGIKIPHFHIHLIPRWINDKLPDFESITYDNDQEINEVKLKIKNAL